MPVYDINGNLISAPINHLLQYSNHSSNQQTPTNNNLNTIGINGLNGLNGHLHQSGQLVCDTIKYFPQGSNQASVLPTTIQTPANPAASAIVNLSHQEIPNPNFVEHSIHYPVHEHNDYHENLANLSNQCSIQNAINLTAFHEIYDQSPGNLCGQQYFGENGEFLHDYEGYQAVYDYPVVHSPMGGNFGCSQDTVVCKPKLNSSCDTTPKKKENNCQPKERVKSSASSSSSEENKNNGPCSLKTTGRYDFVHKSPSDFKSSTCTSSKSSKLISKIKAKARSLKNKLNSSSSSDSDISTESGSESLCSSSESEGIRYNL